MMRTATRSLWAALVVPFSALAASEWPTFQGNLQQTGVSADTAIKVPMTETWSFQTNGPVRAQPVIKGGLVYFGSLDHKFYAVDVLTGKLKWQFVSNGEIFCAASVTDEMVFFGCDGGMVYGLDAATGELKWQSKVCMTPPPTVPTRDGRKGGWKEKHLDPPWRPDAPVAMEGLSKPSQAVIRTPVIVAEGVVLVGTGRTGTWGYLHGFHAGTGKLLWKRPACPRENYRHYSGNESPPVYFNNALYWANPSAMVEALDPRTGQPVEGWPKEPKDKTGHYKLQLSSQIAVNEDGVAVVCAHAFGRTRWWRVSLASHEIMPGQIGNSTRLPHRAIAVVTSECAYAPMLNYRAPAYPAFFCTSLKKGRRQIFQFSDPTGGGPFTRCLLMANGMVFGVTRDGRIYAVNAHATSRKVEALWTHQVKTKVQGTAAVAYGQYMFGGEDGSLRAFASAHERNNRKKED